MRGRSREIAVPVYVSLLTHFRYWIWGVTEDRISDFGEARLLPAWSILESSPLFKDWDWSPLIHNTLEVNGIIPPANSPSALIRKSLPPTHPWAWKAPHDEPMGTPEGLSGQVPNDRGTYKCRLRPWHGIQSFALQLPDLCRILSTS